MAASLILHKKIKTTIAKAKSLKKYIEPLITKSKVDSTNSRRVVFSYLQSKEAVTTLFRDVAAKVADRPGGYTRILKTGARLGDAAEMCIMELVDYNENLLVAKQEKKKTARTRRGGSKTKAAETAATEIAEQPQATTSEGEITDATQPEITEDNKPEEEEAKDKKEE
jgi:large subunit ribosomal protein L17